MRRPLCSVIGQRTDGSLGEIDVRDLDEDSFRAWLVDVLRACGALPLTSGAQLDVAASGLPIYRQKLPTGHPAGRR